MPTCVRCGASFPTPSTFCPYCGAPQGVAPPTAAGFPPPGYAAAPYYAPPKKDNTALIVVVIVIVVALMVALPALLYVMVSGLIQGPSPPMKPFLTFATPQKTGNGSYQLTVAAVSSAAAPSNFRVNFAVDTVTGTATSFPTSSYSSAIVVAGSTTVDIMWVDSDGSGTLSAGDRITIGLSPAPATGTSLLFYLFWSDGSQIQSESWSA